MYSWYLKLITGAKAYRFKSDSLLVSSQRLLERLQTLLYIVMVLINVFNLQMRQKPVKVCFRNMSSLLYLIVLPEVI